MHVRSEQVRQTCAAMEHRHMSHEERFAEQEALLEAVVWQQRERIEQLLAIPPSTRLQSKPFGRRSGLALRAAACC
jgi:hypothetical protein